MKSILKSIIFILSPTSTLPFLTAGHNIPPRSGSGSGPGSGSSKCDVSQAYSILQTMSSSGSSYCSSLLHVSSTVSTKTKTTTVTVTGDCSSVTKTKTEHGTFTTTVYGKTSTLPTITLTEYSSTVLVPSGPAPTINKRSPDSVSADNHVKSSTSTTPTTTTTPALSACASETISSACSSLICPSPTTITMTSTKDKKCSDTTTVTTTTTDHTTTTKIPFLVSPPPIILSKTGVLTTTVPAACASTPYSPNGNGIGNNIIPLGYPYFPQTGVECCVICFTQQNCIASAVIYGDDADTMVVECDLLIHVNGTQPGATSICPLGIQDYPFGSPQVGGNVYPGPCGT